MAELEEILQKLLIPNNTLIQQATAQLREAFKDPSVVPSLISVLSASQNAQVRQFAAVLLRRRIVRQWTKLPPEVHIMLRESLLQILLQEPEPVVRNSAAQVVSVIAKHDLPANQWPELLVFLQQHIKSQQPLQREMGMFLLSSITESAGEQLRPHFTSLFQLFSSTLDDQGSRLVPFYTIRALTYLIECVGTEEIPLVRPLIPKVVAFINSILTIDEDKACDAMEIFDELIESEVSIVTPHLKTLVEFSLQVASMSSCGDNLRVKALYFVSWLARIKPKALVKNKLLVPTISVVFPLMATPPSEEDEYDEDEEEEELEGGTEASRPCAVASQVLDILALHFPPESVIPPLMTFVQPALRSEDPYKRKAALIALAVLAEGCADYIRNRYLEAALQTIGRGLADKNTLVQNAALFALGQYSEYLQPDISKYSADILPLLFERLVYASENGSNSASMTRTYYALETFCENLGEGILPYLPTLMEKLLLVLSPSTSPKLKELAISAIGATASAAKEAMLPYFPRIVELIKEYLTNPGSIEMSILRVQAIDTLGVLARTIGADNFLPLADECIQLGLRLIEEDRDPDLRRCTYGLFASVSTIMKTNMGKYLKDIVKHMIDSLQSTEGIVTHYAGEEDPSFLLEDEDLDQVADEEDDGDDEVTGYSVENAYLEEKEDTCNALGEIAENSRAEFLPYLDESFKEVLKLIQFPHTGVRKGAVMALGQFCCGFHSLLQEAGTEDKTVLQHMLSTAIPTLVTVITRDRDRSVVMATLQSLSEVVKAVKSLIIDENGHPDVIANALRTVLIQKTACQEGTNDDTDDSDQQAEFDAMLIEYAGDILPSLASAIGGQAFVPYFAGFLPLLLKKTRKSCSVSDKSFAIGTISEVLLAMGYAILPFVQPLFPVFMTSLKDEDDEVRSNAIYGLGLLAFYGGDIITPHYQGILEALFVILSQTQPPRVVDNICGAVSRMVMAGRNSLPLEKVFPGLLQCLPLKEDFEENEPVYSCIMELFSDQHPLIKQYLPQLLAIFAQVLPSGTLQEIIRGGLISIIQKVHQQSPQRFQNILAEMPQEHAQVLMTAASAQALS